MRTKAIYERQDAYTKARLHLAQARRETQLAEVAQDWAGRDAESLERLTELGDALRDARVAEIHAEASLEIAAALLEQEEATDSVWVSDVVQAHQVLAAAIDCKNTRPPEGLSGEEEHKRLRNLDGIIADANYALDYALGNWDVRHRSDHLSEHESHEIRFS